MTAQCRLWSLRNSLKRVGRASIIRRKFSEIAHAKIQQLEQVAKEMLSFIERVEQTAYEEFREQLEALGVDVDG